MAWNELQDGLEGMGVLAWLAALGALVVVGWGIYALLSALF